MIALDKRTGEKAIAKCSPEDEFDFEVGAKLAFDRLLSKKPKFKVGDKVIGTAEADKQYAITGKGWRGTVMHCSDDGEISVCQLNRNPRVTYHVEAKYFKIDHS